jgi:hypothetical protein
MDARHRLNYISILHLSFYYYLCTCGRGKGSTHARLLPATSEQYSSHTTNQPHQQPPSSTFLSEQISTSHRPPASSMTSDATSPKCTRPLFIKWLRELYITHHACLDHGCAPYTRTELVLMLFCQELGARLRTPGQPHSKKQSPYTMLG